MAAEVINLKNVWAQYDGMTVLEDINLKVGRDDFLGIIGPNGGGKTTLLKVILGLIRPTRGQVTIGGGSPEDGRRQVGYLPQNSLYDRAFPISVWQAVMMGRYPKVGLAARYGEEDRLAAEKALKAVGMLKYRKRQLGTLSGGEQQRVFIARALIAEPKFLLLDEPTASVDPAMQAEFYELLKELSREMAIVLVSHDISAISVYVDKIACLNRKLYYHGSKEITAEVLEATYQCPVQLIAHGTVPHRVLKEH